MRSLTLLALAAAFVGLLGGCDGCSDQAVGPCAAYGEACGQTCSADSECPSGLYCGDSGCTADCLPDGNDCPGGGVCDSKGRCGDAQAGGGGAGASSGQFMPTGGGGSGGDGAGGGCADITLTLAPTIPTVFLLIDQSGSMTESFGGGTRWDVLYSTLMDPATGIVPALEGQVRFGLALYTGQEGATCPSTTQVSIALNNYAAIDAVYGAAGPLGDTPTGDSIDAIVPVLTAVMEEGPKVIVLATDGEPDTCEQPNPQNGQAEAIAAAQAAFGQAITTYIIAVGNDVSIQHQQDMANAGTGKPIDGSQGNSPYYPAGNQQALVDAFNEIINGVRSCVLTLNGAVDPAKAGEGKVFVDGSLVPFNDPNGWKLNSPTEIELVGIACETIQTGEHTVTATFPCGAVIPE